MAQRRSWWQALLYGPEHAPLSQPAPAPVAATRTQAVREGVFGVGDYDPDAGHSGAQVGTAFSRRLTGPTGRDLNPITTERARAISLGLYDSSPIGKRGVEVSRDYIMGEGISVSAAGPYEAEDAQASVQAVVDAFWKDGRNRLDLRLHDWVLDLSLTGELFVLVAVTPANGFVSVGTLDPALVKQVVHGGDGQPCEVIVEMPGHAGAMERYRVVHVDLDATSDTYGRLVGAPPVGEGQPAYAGSCFAWGINKPMGATRGRPDLLAVADWIDGLEQTLYNEIDRALLVKSFVYDVTLEGMNDQQIADWLKANPAPKPGAIRAHNEKVTWQAVTPNLNAADAAQTVDSLISLIAAGLGIPKVWLSNADVNRATAAEMSGPALKRLSARQRFVRDLIAALVAFALDSAEMAGRLPKRAAAAGMLPAPWSISVNLPELNPRDVAPAAAAFSQLAAATGVAVEAGTLDKESAINVMVLAARGIGYETTAAQVKEKIAAESATDLTDEAAVEEAAAQIAELRYLKSLKA